MSDLKAEQILDALNSLGSVADVGKLSTVPLKELEEWPVFADLVKSASRVALFTGQTTAYGVARLALATGIIAGFHAGRSVSVKEEMEAMLLAAEKTDD
jgi:hypothetical protein